VVTGPFPGVKWPGRGAGHPLPSSAEVKKEHSCASTPPSGLSGLLQGTFTFLCYDYVQSAYNSKPNGKCMLRKQKQPVEINHCMLKIHGNEHVISKQ
jgi:hypothetical protein